jgi:hypothetical protein
MPFPERIGGIRRVLNGHFCIFFELFSSSEAVRKKGNNLPLKYSYHAFVDGEIEGRGGCLEAHYRSSGNIIGQGSDHISWKMALPAGGKNQKNRQSSDDDSCADKKIGLHIES